MSPEGAQQYKPEQQQAVSANRSQEVVTGCQEERQRTRSGVVEEGGPSRQPKASRKTQQDHKTASIGNGAKRPKGAVNRSGYPDARVQWPVSEWWVIEAQLWSLESKQTFMTLGIVYHWHQYVASGGILNLRRCLRVS